MGLSMNKGEFIFVNQSVKNLKKKDGGKLDCELTPLDVISIIENRGSSLVCEIEEDIINKQEGKEHQYGEFILPVQYLDSKENIMERRRIMEILKREYNI